METMKNHFFSDMSVMLGRSMRHIFRSMDTIITVTITPIAMMLLFVFVYGFHEVQPVQLYQHK